MWYCSGVTFTHHVQKQTQVSLTPFTTTSFVTGHIVPREDKFLSFSSSAAQIGHIWWDSGSCDQVIYIQLSIPMKTGMQLASQEPNSMQLIWGPSYCYQSTPVRTEAKESLSPSEMPSSLSLNCLSLRSERWKQEVQCFWCPVAVTANCCDGHSGIGVWTPTSISLFISLTPVPVGWLLELRSPQLFTGVTRTTLDFNERDVYENKCK